MNANCTSILVFRPDGTPKTLCNEPLLIMNDALVCPVCDHLPSNNENTTHSRPQ